MCHIRRRVDEWRPCATGLAHLGSTLLTVHCIDSDIWVLQSRRRTLWAACIASLTRRCHTHWNSALLWVTDPR